MENNEKQRKTRYFDHYTDQTEKKPYKPQKPRQDNASIIIHLRPAERDTLQQLATAAGQDMRSYIATAINAHAGYTVIALTQGKGNRTPRKQDVTQEDT